MPMSRLLMLALVAMGFTFVSAQYVSQYGAWNPTVRTPYTWSDDEIKTLKEVCYSWLDYNVLTLARPSLAMRLWFHDCVGVCDGCINPNDPNNAGLPAFVNDMGTFWATLFPSFTGKYMSNADFWYLMAIVAVQYTVDVTYVFCQNTDCSMPNLYFRFAYGRLDCPTTPWNSLNEGIPLAQWNYPQMMSFYSTKFGMSPAQVTALMGCHTVGRLNWQNSGMTGFWKQTINSIPFWLMFDNTYYVLLYQNVIGSLQLSWTQWYTPWQTWQWNGTFNPGYIPASVMTNVDMALAWQFNVSTTGYASCGPTTCPISPTYYLVQSYANNKTWWGQDLICAFEKASLNNVPTSYLALPTPSASTCGGLNYDFRFPLATVQCYS